MSEMIESIIGRWRRLQPEARKMAWVGLTEKERREVEFALAPCPEESPTGCLSALFPAHPPASPPPTSRLRLATSAYELELSSLSGDEFQTALNTVMLLVRPSWFDPVPRMTA